MTSQTNKRHGSAERIQRKLQSVERSKSAGGRLVSGNISLVTMCFLFDISRCGTVRTKLGRMLGRM